MELEIFDKMGKIRIQDKSDESGMAERSRSAPSSSAGPARGAMSPARGGRGIAHIRATYNNTIITITDVRGNAVAWSSAGAIGFSGAKKATPYAAARVAEAVVEKMRKSGSQ